MLDLLAHRTIKTITVEGMPHFIIIGLYPPPGTIVFPQAKASPSNTILIILFSILTAGALLVVLGLVWRRHKKA